MIISPGSLLGPYQIQEQVGAGGMGEVYRAKDTRLERIVAIKVLPQHLSANAALKQRFEREARVISSLSHPHICSLYDIGHQDGIDYLVMEFVEGETLAQRLSKGPLNTELTLRYAIQILEALDKAHKQGIVHRDLKPANIMVTRSGVKLLDFGLAKLHQPASQQILSGISALQTEQRELTAEGTILGTVQYMSPEQLEGREADARTDIFAFGAVLYEMATGKKAFAGKSHASLIAAILSSEPQPISTIQPMAPPALERVVQNCLAKDPDDRWQTAHDVMLELKWIAGGSQATAPLVSPRRRRVPEWIPWALAVLFFAVLIALFLLRYSKNHRDPDLRVSIVAPEVGQIRYSALSPDGQKILMFATDESGKDHLWIRSLNENAAIRLAIPENPGYPFWSPDSRSIGYFAQGKLKRINLPNGSSEIVCDAPQSEGASWSKNNVILFSHQNSLFRVSASGGTPQRVTQVQPGQEAHRWPWFLPDGNHFLFLDDSNRTETHRLRIGSLDSSETHELLSSFISNMSYAREHVFFVRAGTLMAQQLDQKTFRLTGSPISVAEQIAGSGPNHLYTFSVTEGGRVSYQQLNPDSQLVWFDRAGLKLEEMGEPGRYASMDLSSDGKHVGLEVLDADSRNGEIWVFEFARNIASRYTFDPNSDMAPQWSSDGSKIALGSNRKGGGVDLYVKTGTAPEKLLVSPPLPEEAWPCDWSPDDRYLLYMFGHGSNLDLWQYPFFENEKPHPLFETPFHEWQAQISPDGRWLAYASDETGNGEVYVQPMPPNGLKWQISNGGGWEPRWRGDGKELFFVSRNERLMAVEIRATDNSIEAGIPKPLFLIHERLMGPVRFNYDVSKDGQRFLINTSLDTTENRPIHLIMNWKPDGTD
jgi:eukaryotic-like serine/threonine-protein kinase